MVRLHNGFLVNPLLLLMDGLVIVITLMYLVPLIRRWVCYLILFRRFGLFR